MSDFNGHVKVGRNLAGYLAPLITVGGLLLIFYTTLKPFNFQFRSLTVGNYIAGYDILPSSYLDFPRNVLLFIPLGFGLTAIFDKHGWSRNRVRLAVLICGFLLTLTVESFQLFLPTRQPSVGDLVSNTLGAIVGLLCFRLWQNREWAVDWLREAMAAPEKVLAALAIYTLLLLFMAYGLSTTVYFYEWDADYRLVLGNEPTGDRQWLGSVRDLIIFNRALETGEARNLLKDPEVVLSNDDGLLAYFPLTGKNKELDLTGQQPSFVWQPEDARENEVGAVRFDGSRWLETETGMGELSMELQKTSQVTVRLTVATSELQQSGPARIVTISEDTRLRNLMFGQEGNDLVVRFRNFFTGENGTSPQLLFPEFFLTTDPIDLAVTYDGLAVELLDSQSETTHSVELVPGIAFYIRYIDSIVNLNTTFSQMSAGTKTDWTYRLLYYICVLLPVGILLSLPALKEWPLRFRLILIFCGLLIVPFLLELALVVRSGEGLRPANVVTSMLVIAVVTWVLFPLVFRVISLLGTAHARRG